MLIPAILRQEELKTKFHEVCYSKDMFYLSGDMCNWIPDINTIPSYNDIQYAIIDKNDDLIGYFAYNIDWYASNACGFALISFDRGNTTVAFDVWKEIKKLVYVYKIHRMEFCVVCGNPVERHYDRFCEKYNGCKHVLRDCVKTSEGEYCDKAIYEIIFNSKKEEKNVQR